MIEPTSVFTRRRSRRRTWVVLILLLVAVGSWLAFLARRDPWPARLVITVNKVFPGPMAFTPDSRTLLTSDQDGIVLWDAQTGARKTRWALSKNAYAYDWAFSPDGRTFATAVVSYEGDHTIELFDVPSGRRRTLFTEEDKGNPSIPRDLAFSVDGRTIQVLFGDGHQIDRLVTWDLSTGEQTSTRKPMASASDARPWTISRDGRLVALGVLGTPNVELWDIGVDRSVGLFVATTNLGVADWRMAFSDDGKTLAIGRVDGSVELWDVATRGLLKSIRVHRGGYEPQRLAFTGDGRVLLSSGVYPDGLAGNSWWDQIRSSLARVFPSLGRPPPGEVVAVDLGTGRVLARAPASSQAVVSPDGRTVATLEEDGTVKLRDLP